MAQAKGVAPSYVSRVLRLTLFAPEIVEAILDGRKPEGMRLEDLLDALTVEWEAQRKALAMPQSSRSDEWGCAVAARPYWVQLKPLHNRQQ